MNRDSPIAFMLTVMAMRLTWLYFIGYTIDIYSISMVIVVSTSHSEG